MATIIDHAEIVDILYNIKCIKKNMEPSNQEHYHLIQMHLDELEKKIRKFEKYSLAQLRIEAS